MTIQICFRVPLLYEDDKGNFIPPKYKIELEVSSGPLTEMSYEEIIEALDREQVLRRFGLLGFVDPEEMEFITPEEYEADATKIKKTSEEVF